MKINDMIAAEYLNGQEVKRFSGEWYYTDTGVAGMPENVFTQPKADDKTREKVKIVYDTIFSKAEHFVPTNRRIWDTLFPNWRDVLSEISVDLIVGFPEPFDATVKRDPAGKDHIIFDLVCWSNYVGHCELPNVVQDMLTHELCHILLHQHTLSLSEALASTDCYYTQLDAITFDEGFAHLISYKATEIDTVDWHGEELLKAQERSQLRMRKALNENDPEIRQKNLYDALCGNYYDKFACMCGMLYLANVWLNGGLSALKEEFETGYRGFAEKTAIREKEDAVTV